MKGKRMLIQEVTNRLKEPFPAETISWRPGPTSKDAAIGLAYVDAREYQNRLDKVWPEWADEYEMSDDGTRVLCRLTICGITRCDVGEELLTNKNTITSAAAQAFKRACAKFGLGRYLYSMPQIWAEYSSAKKKFTGKGLNDLSKIAIASATRKPQRPSGTTSAGSTEGSDESGDKSEDVTKAERPYGPEALRAKLHNVASRFSAELPVEQEAYERAGHMIRGIMGDVSQDEYRDVLEYLWHGYSPADIRTPMQFELGMVEAIKLWLIDKDTGKVVKHAAEEMQQVRTASKVYRAEKTSSASDSKASGPEDVSLDEFLAE
jgi:hypothetical protein